VNQVFNRKLKTDLDGLREAGTFKHLRHITTPMAAMVHMTEAGDAIVLSSNNYLGLADNPRVVEAGIEGLRHYGAGTASVRFICGTLDIHKRLEERIARFLGTENSLTYVSCWAANTGLIPTIAVEGTAIVSDELNHASIIDGCRMATQAQRLRYKHADMADLEAKLANFEAKKGSDGLTKFVPHVIDSDSGIGTQFYVGDVNGDGLLDVVTSNKKGTYLFEQVREKK